MSTLVLLSRAGLVDYYCYFEKAGYKWFDATAHPSDEEVDQILAETERNNGITFMPETKIQLWKAMRYQWFQGPQTVRPFVDKSQVPILNLPEEGYTQPEPAARWETIEPGLARTILRKQKPSDKPVFRGPAIDILQFEVRKRQRDIFYEFKDLERCVDEWHNKDPHMMSREDAREEMMKLRIRDLELRAGDELTVRRKLAKDRHHVSLLLDAFRLVAAGMTVLMVVAAYYPYRNTPRQLRLDFVMGSRQFLSGMAYTIAYAFTYVVSKRRRPDKLAIKLQRLLYTCQRLQESISDLRIETEALRLSPEAVGPQDVIVPPSVVKAKKAKRGKSRDVDPDANGEGSRRRHRKKKKDKAATPRLDASIALWAGPDAEREAQDNGELVQALQKSMEASYKTLPELPGNLRKGTLKWHGGDRTAIDVGKSHIPDWYENKLCVRLPAPPKAPSRAALPQVPFNGEMPAPPQPALPPPPQQPALLPPPTNALAPSVPSMQRARAAGAAGRQ